MNIYDFLVSRNSDCKLTDIEKKEVLEKFIERFVDKQVVSENILYWNSIKSEFKTRMKRIDFDKLNSINESYLDNLYIYLERHKEVFIGNIQIIIDFLEQQEPWEDTDIIGFDRSFNWFIALTHEDEIIYIDSYLGI